ncbi:AAA family ATPase [Lysobacter auxotrophicus]|uniref:Flagellar biosynthesis protein FlhF n=1 Tax=Lysobacter auxotrophicus TaxID=2992573 RepID=A0ABM8DH02_9GAMM|nr:AAA family ATPase [Lysobacter auxotrophicus]BDU17866.1 flagellar biosynthesis protein FlhF [Lysobacter auxotrophicus]
MRIKRFTAPDMRTALRMVRDEQGPDAVILSNRPTQDGIEIVAATDYDESLAQQALRAALPSMPTPPAPVASPTTPATAAAVPTMRATAPAIDAVRADAIAASNATPSVENHEEKSRFGSLAALLTKPSKPKAAWTAPSTDASREDTRAVDAVRPHVERIEMKNAEPAQATRIEVERDEPAVVALSAKAKAKVAESPIRGRAVFAIGDGTPVQAAPVEGLPAPAASRAPKDETRVAAAMPPPDTSRFDAMMAALIPQGDKFMAASIEAAAQGATRESVTDPAEVAPTGSAAIGDAVLSLSANGAEGEAPVVGAAMVVASEYRSLADLWTEEAPVAAPIEEIAVEDLAAAEGSPSFLDLGRNHFVAPHPNPSPAGRGAQGAATSNAVANASDNASGANMAPSTTHLHAVPENRDPAFIAMRDELATMRALIERELGQLTVERLRGSPARAAAFDMLVGYGCDENLAQTIAGRIDARLDPAQVREPMLEELARAISVARHEPIDDGGVIALVGPTGAGKTTTAAKLAARFAQRHRARDVALVTTDTERPGATEQLHILGRRLGVTVCEAAGPEALNDALDQLADYPLVLVDTAGHGLRDRALLGQILWLRAAKRVRSLLVLPANTNAHDLGEVVRRYRPASPEGVVLTKLDETGRLGSPLSVLVQQGLSLAYTTDGQAVPTDIAAADATRLVSTLEKVRRAADNPLGSLELSQLKPRPVTLPTEDRHAFAS